MLRDGFKIIDMDTHVNPTMEVLEKYSEPSFRSRLDELKPYYRTRMDAQGIGRSVLSVGPITYNRYPGEAPTSEDVKVVVGQKDALEGRTRKQHRADPELGVQDENSEGRLLDMDREGRDIDMIFPATWATTSTGLEDVTLGEGLYTAYHHYMQSYSSAAPDRLRSSIQVTGADPEWSVSEIKRWGNEKWAAAVWIHLKEGLPIDHPQIEPIFATMNDLNLPMVHHSFFFEPPYFPGYQDLWGNMLVARAAAHPWGAARLGAYMILSGLFDRYPNLRFATSETGHGWLPNWVIRLSFHKSYLPGVTPDLKYTPLEYCQMGRWRCAAEPFEGPVMTKATIDVLGEDCLMHQSDYPHGESWFPETAKEVMDWDFWPDLSRDALKKHMYDNAASFLRLS